MPLAAIGEHIQFSSRKPRRREALAFESAPLVGERMNEYREPISWGLDVALPSISAELLEGIIDIP